jgi:mannose-6-phosphate isomerase-like protein (cupin superfamily)
MTPQVLAASPAPKVVHSGEGEAIDSFGDGVRVLLGGAQTGGSLLLIEARGEPGGGPPLHVHQNEDQLFAVLEGCYEFVLGSERFEARPGAVVFGPRGVPHTFRVVSDKPGRMLEACLPGGCEGFFRLLAREFATGAPNTKHIAREGEGYGITFLSPEDAAQRAFACDAIRPKIVRPDEGECHQSHGTRARVILTSEDTKGALGLVELTTPPGRGPTLHSHTHEEEIFLVQEGLYEFQIGDEKVEVGPGGVVYAPRPHAHSFRVVSDEPGRMLVMFAPGGFERFFPRALTYLQSVDGPPDASKLAQIGAELGLVDVSVDAEARG